MKFGLLLCRFLGHIGLVGTGASLGSRLDAVPPGRKIRIFVEVGLLVGSGWSPNTSALDLHPDHAVGQFGMSSKEVGVVISIAVRSLGDALEAIQVQLPLEGWVLGLSKILWHDQVDKFLLLVNDKASTMWLPRGNVLQPIGGVALEHSVELDRKGLGDTVGLRLWGSDGDCGR